MNKGLIIIFTIICLLNVMSFVSIYYMELYEDKKIKKYNFVSILTIIMAGLSWFLLLALLIVMQLSPLNIIIMECIYIIPQAIYHFIKHKDTEDVVKVFLKEKLLVVVGLITPIIIIAVSIKPLIDNLF